MRSANLILVGLIALESARAALLPSSESSNTKVLPSSSSSTKLLPTDDAGGQVLPSSTSTSTKLLPSPASSTGGGDFFSGPTGLKLTKFIASDVGNNSSATREIGEPLHGGYSGNPGGKSLWWRYEARFNGHLTVSTAGSDFDTVLGVYIGDSVAGLSTLASDNNSGSNQTSMVTLPLVLGSIYYIAVDGYNGASGNISLNLVGTALPATADARPINDDYDDRVELRGSYVTDYGTNYNATDEAEDLFADIFFASIGQTVWWSWTAPVAGKVTIATAGSDFDTLLLVYRRYNSGATGYYYSDDVSRSDRSSAIVANNVVAGEVFDISVDGFSEAAGTIILTVDQQPERSSPSNDAFDFRIGIGGSSYSFDTTTANARSREAGEPVHGNVGTTSSTNSSLWWTWTAPGNGIVTLTATATPANGTRAASAVKPIIAVYTGRSVSTLTQVSTAVDSDFDGDAKLSFQATKGQIYQIAVAEHPSNTTSGTFTFDLDYVSGAPVIKTQPKSTSVDEGDDASFSVSVTSTTIKPVTYKWERKSGKTWIKVTDGSDYSGATTSKLKVLNVTTLLNGAQFRCTVKNSEGKVTSSTAKLTVD